MTATTMRQRYTSIHESMTEFLGIKFAPLNVPLERRLQTFGAMTHLFMFLIAPILTLILPIYLFFTSFWFLPLFYFAWMYYDWDSPRRGSYSSIWWRNLPMNKLLANYFPIKLHKTVDLPTEKNYLIGIHPHGIASMAAFVNFGTNGTGCHEMYPGIDFHLCTLEGQFWFPLRREWGLLHGLIACSKESISYLIGGEPKGKAAILVVGGAEEALDAHPGKNILTLKPRRGFIRLAIQNGASLIPCYSFGENDIYDQTENPKGSKLRNVQTYMKKALGFSPPLFRGRGVFTYNLGFLPYRKPINTVLGAPIDVKKNSNPTKEEVQELHNKYMDELEKLFDEHKTKYGYSKEDKLTIQ